jgi:hypothetical protein
MTMIKQRLSLDFASHAWTEVLSRELETRGFASLSAYVDSRPEASLAVLASDLGGPDTTPIALEQRLIAEETMERCARGILARKLRDELPEGWRSDESDDGDEMTRQARRLSEVFLALAIALPEAYRDAIDRVQQAMHAAELPAGWLPEVPSPFPVLSPCGEPVPVPSHALTSTLTPPVPLSSSGRGSLRQGPQRTCPSGTDA